MKKRILCNDCVSMYHYCDKCNDTGWVDVEVEEEPNNKRVLIIHIEESGYNPFHKLETILKKIENQFTCHYGADNKQVLGVTFSEIVETKEPK